MENQQVNTAIQKVNTQHISALSMKVSLSNAYMHLINYKLIPPPPVITLVKFILQGFIAGILCRDIFMPVRRMSSRAFVIASGVSDGSTLVSSMTTIEQS